MCRKSLERKSSQEKRERERDREHADDKRKEKEKPVKEESVKRPEKDVKKTEPASIKKPDPSVSPKKLQSATLPVTRHRVSSQDNYSRLKYVYAFVAVRIVTFSCYSSFQRVYQEPHPRLKRLKTL